MLLFFSSRHCFKDMALHLLVHALLLSHFQAGSHCLAEADLESPMVGSRYGTPHSSMKSLLGGPPSYLRCNFGSM